MTRQEILDLYEVDEHGIIRSPGKFEAEPIYAPYFYDLSMDGCPDFEDRNGNQGFKVTPEDRAMFPEIPRRKRTIWVSEDSQGFVYVS